MDEHEVKRIAVKVAEAVVKKAIADERKRIANILRNSSIEYTGSNQINWDKTMENIAKEISPMVEELIFGTPFQNPFIVSHLNQYNVGFLVPNNADPLWWIGEGFKDLNKVKATAVKFVTYEEAKEFIRNKGIPFIKKWRTDQVDLIKGW